MVRSFLTLLIVFFFSGPLFAENIPPTMKQDNWVEQQRNFDVSHYTHRFPSPSITLYVAPDGNDEQPGTKKRPFATLEAARDTLRQLKKTGKLSKGGAKVIIRGGRYSVRQTFSLTHDDSGEPDKPIRYCAARGETPIFSGSLKVDNFLPVTDAHILQRLPDEARGKVQVADLSLCGIDSVPPLILGGFGKKAKDASAAVVELYFEGNPMPLARWPNEGFVQVAGIPEEDAFTMFGRKGSKAGIIYYEGDRPSRWLEESDGYLYGYWFFGWADSYERIASIDAQKRSIRFQEPFAHYGYRAEAPYYAVNMLCEIDMPGEWYLDRTNKLLYFYPPADLAGNRVELSWFSSPFVSLEDVAFVTFEGLAWEMGAVNGIEVKGGTHCTFAGCTIRNFAGNGIRILEGTNHAVVCSDIHTMGQGGLIVKGGDRKTLTPGNHLVENCHIYNLSRIYHTYRPAVLLEGVGNRVAHNLVHDIPSSAFRIEGNDHIVEFNHVHHVVLESDDQGAIDIWGNVTYRGNVFRYNWWHDIGNQINPHDHPECGHAGIRLDDAISGQLIYGNLFERASAGKAGFGAIQIHGGKDNLIVNNVFNECMAAVSLSSWGDKRWKEFVENHWKSQDIDQELYLQRYPELSRLLQDVDANTFKNNLVMNCENFFLRYNERSIVENNIELKGKHPLPDETKKKWKEWNKLLKQNHCQPIPFKKIGLYTCPLRKNMPK